MYMFSVENKILDKKNKRKQTLTTQKWGVYFVCVYIMAITRSYTYIILIFTCFVRVGYKL